MNKRFLPLTILSAFLLVATFSSAQTAKQSNAPTPSLVSVKITDPKSSNFGGTQTFTTGRLQTEASTPVIERTGSKPAVESKTKVAVTPTSSAGVASAKQNTKETIIKSNVSDATKNYVAPKKVVYGVDGAILKDTPKK